jgi:hypothetical protein
LASLISFLKERNRSAPTWLKVLVPFLALGGLGVVALGAAITAFLITGWLGQPIPVLGFDQTFEQPINFPHTVHAGTDQLVDATTGQPRTNQNGEPLMALGLDCTFCHRTVTEQANAGVPPVAQCSFCHQVIGPGSSPDLTELRTSAGIIGDSPSPVNWKRVHRMPDHVRFVHEPHIRYLTQNPSAIANAPDPAANLQASVEPALVCSTCHGDVASMTQVEQVEPLKMGQCVNCHRDNGAPTDCAVCHH